MERDVKEKSKVEKDQAAQRKKEKEGGWGNLMSVGGADNKGTVEVDGNRGQGKKDERMVTGI